MMTETQLQRLAGRLYQANLLPPDELIEKLLAQGDAVRPILLAIATDTSALVGDEPECWAPLHALRLLIEMPDESIIEPILSILPVPWSGAEDDPGIFWAQEAAHVLAACGDTAVPQLWQWFDDPAHNVYSKIMVLETLVIITLSHPEIREELIARFRELLADSDDITIRSQAVRGLANLAVRDAYAEIMQAYREKRINTDLLPPAEARQRLFGKPAEELGGALLGFWARYDIYGPFDPDDLPDYDDDY